MEQKQEVINRLEFTGIVEPRYRNGIQIMEVNGKHVTKFNLKCSEFIGMNQNNQPMMSTTTVRVNAWTGNSITLPILQSIVPGMRIHVIGRWKNDSITNRRTGQTSYETVCTAATIDILQNAQPYQYPQQGYQSQPQNRRQGQYQGQPQYGGAPMQPQQGGFNQQYYQGQPQIQQQQGYGYNQPVQNGGYAPQGMPRYSATIPVQQEEQPPVPADFPV